MQSFKSIADSLDVSSRAKRRLAVNFVIGLLEKIRMAEEHNLDRFPVNLQGGDAYAASDYSHDIIIDAIVGLSDAY
jgi:hypothetical protein